MSIYSDMVVCDLRHIVTVEQARAIESINDIAILLLPKDSTNEVAAAIAEIERSDIALELHVNENAEICTINGNADIGDISFNEKNEYILIINGFAVLSNIKYNCKISICLNGTLIINEKFLKNNDSNFTFLSINGFLRKASFDDYKYFKGSIEIDADMIKYLPENFTIISMNEIIIDENVTIDILEKSGIKFISQNNIKCKKNISGYIKAFSIVGNNVIITE